MHRLLGATIIGGILLALSACGATASDPIKVFVLAGQSNMVGEAFPLSAGEKPSKNVLVWRDDGWHIATDPLNIDQEPPAGVGPGLTFGKRIAAHTPGVRVGLVMCAVGGTPIDRWQKGGDLYSRCMDRVHAAGGTVVGTLFLQGESDAERKPTADAWLDAFYRFHTDWQHDVPGVFLMGQIGTIDPKFFPYQQEIRDEQETAAKTLGLPLVRTVDQPTFDHIHFTAAAARTVGQRFYTAWLCANGRRASCRSLAHAAS